MNVGQRGLDLIFKWEGCEKLLKNGTYIAYLDTLPSPNLWSPGYSGLWTIGVGSTGPGITEGTIWTKAQCMAALNTHASQKAREVSAYLTRKINQNQFDALVSLAYNIGTGGIHGILNLVNAGQFDEAAESFVNYNHAGGKVVQGLTNRRLDERELFEWESPKEVKQLSVPIQRADQINTGLVGGGLGVGAIWQALPQAQEMAKDHVGLIMLCGLGVTIGLVYLFKKYFHVEFNNGTYIPEGTKPVPTPITVWKEEPADANA